LVISIILSDLIKAIIRESIYLIIH